MLIGSVDVSGCLSKFEVDKMLEDLDAYIVDLAQKYVPRTLIPAEVLSLEVDEIAQNARIKLWQALRKEHIEHPRSYVRTIVYNESVNVVRRYRRVFPLPLNEDGELYHGTIMLTSDQGAHDPADEFVWIEALVGCTKKVAEDVIRLPPRQQKAVIYALKEQIADILPLVNAFSQHGLNIDQQSEEKETIRNLQASLSIARKKLRAMRDVSLLEEVK
ncbi:MAG TPA: hypothetical protein VEL31_14525 [Ktedonobacteraceae bacterium]|nr:hypothetical protein [Ktedonobacteraceae bacterium]